jgi:hypothetical protein
MFHPQLKAAIRFFLISILLILPAKIAGACSCPPRANVLDAYEAADEVLIVRVLSVAAVDQTLECVLNMVVTLLETVADKGRCSLRVIKGLTGNVSSETYIFAGIFGNCPAVDALVKHSPEKNLEIKTPAIRIEAAHDLRNLVLRFPFPKCKAKRVGNLLCL